MVVYALLVCGAYLSDPVEGNAEEPVEADRQRAGQPAEDVVVGTHRHHNLVPGTTTY